MRTKFPLNKVYQLLGSGPVVLISSSLDGKPNVMPIAWTTMLDFDPPLIGCCIGDHSYTFQVVKKTKEFVINIPDSRLAKTVVDLGSVSGKSVDKFANFGLTPVKASKVKAPLVGECFINLECKVVDTSLIEKYNLFIVKVVAAWQDKAIKKPKTLHHVTGRKFILGGKIISA